MSKKEEKRELISNADWILYQESDGSVTAESRKGEAKVVISSAFLRDMRSLIALIEGSGVKIE